jgi:p-aminobenzoyl-glutamate transporter AbgT
MALSEGDERLLRQIEADFAAHPGVVAATRAFLVHHWRALLTSVCAVVAVVLGATAGAAPVVAPLAGVCGAAAGYHVCCSRVRRGHRP